MADELPPPVNTLTQSQQRIQELWGELWNDSTHGPALRKKAKEKYPDIITPEDTFAPVIDPLRAQVEELAKQNKELLEARDADSKKREEESFRKTFEASVDAAAAKLNLTDEGRAMMLDRMKTTGNYYDAEASATWVAQQAPKVDVDGPSWLPKNMNLWAPEEADQRLSLLHKNSDAFVDAELREFAKDPEAYARNG